MSAAVLEVAESMYQAARGATPVKMPESLDLLDPRTQRRYLMLAEAAISVTGPLPSGGDREPLRLLADELAEQLSWKLLHPQQFADSVRSVLARYAEAVGPGAVSEEVQGAMQI